MCYKQKSCLLTQSQSGFQMVAASVFLLSSMSTMAQAQTTTVVSNTIDWRQSTTIDSSNSNSVPWPGLPFTSVPNVSTFTVVPTSGSATNPITGATTLLSGSDVRFYRTVFNLPVFSTITSDVRIFVDNDVDIFINGNELAQIGTLSASNFSGAQPLRVGVDTAGVVTNAFSGGQGFTRVAASFPGSRFNSGGSNEIILMIRNLSGDSGGFTFRADFVTAAGATAPEPGTIGLVILGGIAGTFLNRRKKQLL